VGSQEGGSSIGGLPDARFLYGNASDAWYYKVRQDGIDAKRFKS
jgi:hypothetical protein